MSLDKFVPITPEQEDIKKTKTVDLQKDEPGFKGKNIYEIRNKVEKMNKPEAKEFLKLWIDIGKKRNELNKSSKELFLMDFSRSYSLFDGRYQVYKGNTLTIVINVDKVELDGRGENYKLKIQLTDDGSILCSGKHFRMMSKKMQEQSNGKYPTSSIKEIEEKLESVEALKLINEVTGDFNKLLK